MQVEILAVPGCPNRSDVVQAVHDVLDSAGRSDVTVVERTITDLSAAVEAGMRGSPTILVDGLDPFTLADFEPSLSCRVRSDIPSVEQLREVLAS